MVLEAALQLEQFGLLGVGAEESSGDGNGVCVWGGGGGGSRATHWDQWEAEMVLPPYQMAHPNPQALQGWGWGE